VIHRQSRVKQRCEQLVEIGRSRAGDRDLSGRRADMDGQLFRDAFAQGDPRRLGIGPAADAQDPPFVDHALQMLLGPAGKQSERIAVEVDLVRRQENSARKRASGSTASRAAARRADSGAGADMACSVARIRWCAKAKAN